jgi:large subunit ribosomal protein L23Ae
MVKSKTAFKKIQAEKKLAGLKYAKLNREKKAKEEKKEEVKKEEVKTEEKKETKKIKKNIEKALKKGIRPRTRKVWTDIKFKRPKTLQLKGKPKYARRGIPKRRAIDMYSALKYPLTTEKCMDYIEYKNTLVFIVDNKCNKKQIRKAFAKMYQVKVDKVRTLVRPTGEKKAFIKLSKGTEAVDIASKIGIV